MLLNKLILYPLCSKYVLTSPIISFTESRNNLSIFSTNIISSNSHLITIFPLSSNSQIILFDINTVTDFVFP